MLARPLLNHILENEALTRGLEDPEARVMVEWLVENAERMASEAGNEEDAWQELQQLCRRARGITRFVVLWCHGERGSAVQLAAAERFPWPLPTQAIDPCQLMKDILSQQTAQVAA